MPFDAINCCVFVLNMRLIFFLLAWHFSLVLLFMSKCICSTINFMACFVLLNVFVCCYPIPFLDNFLDDVLERSADSVASLGMNLIRWCILPINDLNSLNVFGCSNKIIAFVFLLVVVVPSELILYPSQVISVKPNSHLCRVLARFSSSSLCSVLSISFSCCSCVLFVFIIISSRNPFVEFNPFSDLSIIF